jgi:hypothetical protein
MFLLDIIIHINDGGGFVREEGVIDVIEHFGVELANDGLRLDVEVAHHAIAVTSPHHADVHQVDASMEHFHVSSGACRYAGRMEVGHHRLVQHIHYILGLDRNSPVSPVEDRNWSIWFRLMQSVVLQSSGGCFDWEAHPISQKALYHFSPFVSFFCVVKV